MGKFIGILLAPSAHDNVAGWAFNGVLYFKPLCSTMNRAARPELGTEAEARFGPTFGQPAVSLPQEQGSGSKWTSARR